MEHIRSRAVCEKSIWAARDDQTYADGVIAETAACFSKLLNTHWTCSDKFKSPRDKGVEAINQLIIIANPEGLQKAIAGFNKDDESVDLSPFAAESGKDKVTRKQRYPIITTRE